MNLIWFAVATVTLTNYVASVSQNVQEEDGFVRAYKRRPEPVKNDRNVNIAVLPETSPERQDDLGREKRSERTERYNRRRLRERERYEEPLPEEGGNPNIEYHFVPVLKLRLNGGPTYREGRVEMYSDDLQRWETVCPDVRSHETADLICKELGFSRGVEEVFHNGSDYGSHYAPLSYTLTNQRRHPRCSRRDRSLSECRTQRRCADRWQAIAVRCKEDKTGCGQGWIGSSGMCYKVSSLGSSFTAARTKCLDMEAQLLSLETAEENHFITAAAATLQSQISGDTFMLWTSGQRSVMAGSRWEWSATNQGIVYSKWFPGWPPANSGQQPVMGAGECLALSNLYQNPNGNVQNVDYQYWKNVPCSQSLIAICEKIPTISDDCYEANGISYRGTVSVTLKGTPCQKWSETAINAELYPGTGLGDHNYCRNPDGDVKPWCIVNEATKDWGFCNMKECSEVGVNIAPIGDQDVPVVDCMVGDGSDYRGMTAVTQAGTPCVQWSMSSVINAMTHPNMGLGNHNYCRNPDESRGPWCWIQNGQYGFCNVEMCEGASTPPPTGCLVGSGEDYRGTHRVTHLGTLCVDWTSSSIINPDTHPGMGLGGHNYCRNPDGSGSPWCWVDGGQYGYCSIPDCEDTTTSQTPSHPGGPPSTTTAETTTGHVCEGFYCPDSRICIPTAWRCDGEEDCMQGEDEHNCMCSEHELQCPGTSTCYPLSYKCDGDEDCPDGFDEQDCDCDEDEIFCLTSSNVRECVPASKRCDGVRDCLDASDEEDGCDMSCADDEFLCGSFRSITVCIPQASVCDGVADCPFRVDERNCSVDTNPCGNVLVPCSPGQDYCVFPDWICDGEDDCPQGEDENDCAMRPTVSTTTPASQTCNEGDFLCTSALTNMEFCAPNSWKCDESVDCMGGIDEQNCNNFLDRFELHPGKDLLLDEVMEMAVMYVDVSAEQCAQHCVEATQLMCVSFAHNATSLECTLYSLRSDQTGLVDKLGINFFQLLLQAIDCYTINMFSCRNGKCISLNQVCDGRDQCGDFTDEEVCSDGSPPSVQVRLAGGSKESEGRVEVQYMGEWGVVCDDDWDKQDAGVVCRQLGYPGALQALGMSAFDAGNGNILLDNVMCTGSEESLAECQHPGWGTHDCFSHEIAGVRCMTNKACSSSEFTCGTTQNCLPAGLVCDGMYQCLQEDRSDESNCAVVVELVGGRTPQEGRLEIVRNGLRGTVCKDAFMDTAASVVCRMLGHQSGVMIVNEFGEGDGLIWLDDVICYGDESSIDECSHSPWGTSNCVHREDVAVRCEDTPSSTPSTTTEDSGTTTPLVMPTCGIVGTIDPPSNTAFSSRIIGGRRPGYGEFPWQASILHYGSQFCGGTIITERWIVSAAHCYIHPNLNKERMEIGAGDYDLSTTDKMEQIGSVEEVINHPNYDPATNDFDIALIKVKAPGITFGEYVQPACLPTPDTEYTAGLTCKISGWGSVSVDGGRHIYGTVMEAADVPIQSENTCDRLYKQHITDRMFCAGDLRGGIDTCKGDSGGPLVCEVDGVNTLFGVTSFGFGCAEPNSPGIYAHVQNLRQWIDRTMQSR